MKDSIFVRQKSDTVFVDRWHTQYREKVRADTIHTTDTLRVSVAKEVIKEVEVNKIKGWQRFLMWSGATFIVLLVAAIAYKIVKTKTSFLQWLKKLAQRIATLLKR